LGATQGRIRLNIELKPHGRADEEPLVEGVVALLRDRNLLARSRICSQSYQAIQHARKLAPEVEIGFIAANALGDLSKLRVNYLMVARELATRELVERARLRQIEVHPWTINDPKWVAPLLDAGCANIITDDPARLRARLEEIRQLGTVDRLLLRAREVLRD
jgi:glycerophosphoryl diester phosphodiesterase